MNLESKIAIVTGAASGFGAAIARRMVQAGARVMLADLNAEGAERMARTLRDEGGQTASCGADVSSQADFTRLGRVNTNHEDRQQPGRS